MAARASYIPTSEGWLYLAAILDLYSRLVVGWAVSEHIDTQLCLDAFAMAVKARRPAPGLLHHSDRGSQYASRDYRRAYREVTGVRVPLQPRCAGGIERLPTK